jgi:hypothetical protein
MEEKASEGGTPFFSYCPNVISLPTAGFEEVLVEAVVLRGSRPATSARGEERALRGTCGIFNLVRAKRDMWFWSLRRWSAAEPERVRPYCERSETLLEGGRGLALSLRSYSFLLFLYYLTEAFCGGKSRVCPGKNILRSSVQ